MAPGKTLRVPRASEALYMSNTSLTKQNNLRALKGPEVQNENSVPKYLSALK